jgi:hypothetical protein
MEREVRAQFVLISPMLWLILPRFHCFNQRSCSMEAEPLWTIVSFATIFAAFVQPFAEKNALDWTASLLKLVSSICPSISLLPSIWRQTQTCPAPSLQLFFSSSRLSSRLSPEEVSA